MHGGVNGGPMGVWVWYGKVRIGEGVLAGRAPFVAKGELAMPVGMVAVGQ